MPLRDDPKKINAYNKQYRNENPDKVKQWNLTRYAKNKEKMREASREYRKNNPGKIKQYQKKYRENNLEKINLQKSNHYHNDLKHDPKWIQKQKDYITKRVLKIKIEVFTHYSNGTPKCACCGETMLGALTVDHINNDGAKDRKNHLGGISLWLHIKKINYPLTFRILCYNCNIARSRMSNKLCPHGHLGR